MAVELSKLMEAIGIAVQNANLAIEGKTAETYLKQGYKIEKKEDENKEVYVPITCDLNIASGNDTKTLKVPITVLIHHTSLQLEQVDVKLNFILEESNEEKLMVRIGSLENNESSYCTSQLSMQFKTAPPAEGTARLENKYIQTL